MPAARAAVTSTPGATTSGLSAPLRKRGPRLEKPAITSLTSTAPTVRAASAEPGAVTVEGPLPPLLPAATTNRLSEVADSSLIASGERAAAVVGVATQAHADDVSTLVDGPDHAGQDPRVLTPAAVAQDLADHQAGLRGDALAEPAGRGTGPADRRGDVGAVAVAVGDRGVGREVGRRPDPTLEVGMRRVVAGVQHGHRGADAVVAGRPRLGGVDLGDRVLQGHLDAAVEVDAGGAVGQGGRVAGSVLAPGEVGPELPAVLLLGVERGDAEARHGHGALGALQGGRSATPSAAFAPLP